MADKDLATQIIDDLAQGDRSFEGLPEFGAYKAPESAKWKLALGFFTTPDERARADIIRKVLPEAKLEEDPEGRIVVNYKGERGYINKPGFSARDVLDVLGGIVKYVPAARYAAGGTTAIRQGLRMLTGAGLTSVAEDVAAIPQGSEQGIDPVRAGVTAAAATAGQAVSPYLARTVSRAGAAMRDVARVATGRQSVAAQTARQAAMQQAGQDLSLGMQAAAKEATEAGIPEEQIPIVAERLALLRRFNLIGTKGDITGDFEQQALEDSLRNADVTTAAGRHMRQFEQAARERLMGPSGQSGFGQLQSEIGGRIPVADVDDAGQVVAQGIRNRAVALRDEVRAAYEAARAAGAGVRQGAVRSLVDDVERALQDDFIFDPSLQPKTAQILNHLRKIDEAIGSGEISRKAIPIQRVENIRKLISRSARDQSLSPDDAAALQVVLRQFDDWADNLATTGKLTGDKTAIETFKTARALRAKYGQMFQAPNSRSAGQSDVSAGKFIENLVKDDQAPGYQLVNRAINEPAVAARVLQVVGRESPEHLALKQGALQRVFSGAIKDGQLSPQRFVTLYEQYFGGKNKAALRVIFNEKDREAIDQFARAMRVLIRQPGTYNPSRTSYKLAQMAQQLFQKLGLAAAVSGSPEMMVAGEGVRRLSDRAAASQARAATRGLVPRPRTAPYAAGLAGTGEAATSDRR